MVGAVAGIPPPSSPSRSASAGGTSAAGSRGHRVHREPVPGDPGLPLKIVIAAYLQNGGIAVIIAVIVVTGWAWGARVLRSQTQVAPRSGLRDSRAVSPARAPPHRLPRDPAEHDEPDRRELLRRGHHARSWPRPASSSWASATRPSSAGARSSTGAAELQRTAHRPVDPAVRPRPLHRPPGDEPHPDQLRRRRRVQPATARRRAPHAQGGSSMSSQPTTGLEARDGAATRLRPTAVTSCSTSATCRSSTSPPARPPSRRSTRVVLAAERASSSAWSASPAPASPRSATHSLACRSRRRGPTAAASSSAARTSATSTTRRSAGSGWAASRWCCSPA